MYFYETTTKDACTTATERLGLFLFDDANFKVESVDSLIGSPMTELMRGITCHMGSHNVILATQHKRTR